MRKSIKFSAAFASTEDRASFRAWFESAYSPTSSTLTNGPEAGSGAVTLLVVAEFEDFYTINQGDGSVTDTSPQKGVIEARQELCIRPKVAVEVGA